MWLSEGPLTLAREPWSRLNSFSVYYLHELYYSLWVFPPSLKFWPLPGMVELHVCMNIFLISESFHFIKRSWVCFFFFFSWMNFPGNKLRALHSWGTWKKHPEQLNSPTLKSTTQLCFWSVSLWEFKCTLNCLLNAKGYRSEGTFFFPSKWLFIQA